MAGQVQKQSKKNTGALNITAEHPGTFYRTEPFVPQTLIFKFRYGSPLPASTSKNRLWIQQRSEFRTMYHYPSLQYLLFALNITMNLFILTALHAPETFLCCLGGRCAAHSYKQNDEGSRQCNVDLVRQDRICQSQQPVADIKYQRNDDRPISSRFGYLLGDGADKDCRQPAYEDTGCQMPRSTG